MTKISRNDLVYYLKFKIYHEIDSCSTTFVIVISCIQRPYKRKFKNTKLRLRTFSLPPTINRPL